MPDYRITPYDVLFFRGNKSFDFGRWFTEGIFPPYPSTFQGFIRNKMLVDDEEGLIAPDGKLTNEAKAKSLVGDDHQIKVDIKGPYLMEGGNIYFPTPADLYRKCSGTTECCSAFPISVEDHLESDLEYRLLCPEIAEDKPEKSAPPEFIELERLQSYRLSLKDITVDSTLLTVRENRVGIGLDREHLRKGAKAAGETLFYVTPYQRLRNGVGFYCHTDKALKNGPLKLGSESHLVSVEQLEGDDRIERRFQASREELIQKIIETKTFRMVLLQPGVFASGWLPFTGQPDRDQLILKRDGLVLRLIFAFVNAPVRISGYSFAQNRGAATIGLKPLVNAVPAGAVYMFQILDGMEQQIRDFVKSYDNQKIINSEADFKHYAAMGFNHVVLATGPIFPQTQARGEVKSKQENAVKESIHSGRRWFTWLAPIKGLWQ